MEHKTSGRMEEGEEDEQKRTAEPIKTPGLFGSLQN